MQLIFQKVFFIPLLRFLYNIGKIAAGNSGLPLANIFSPIRNRTLELPLQLWMLYLWATEEGQG